MWQLSSEYFVADAEAEWQTVLIPTLIAKYTPTARLFESFGDNLANSGEQLTYIWRTLRILFDII